MEEGLSCYPNLELASSWRQKPCAQMCWSSVHPSVTQTWVQELFFEMREDFLFQLPIVLPLLAVLGLQHSPESPWSLKHVSTFRECFITDLKKQWFEHNGLIMWTLMLSHDQKNNKKKANCYLLVKEILRQNLLPLLHCRGQRKTVQQWHIIVTYDIPFSLWVVLRMG